MNNIPPASSYWQTPSLITEHAHNSVSICYQDNNGPGLLHSPHTGFLLLSVIPPSLRLELFFVFFISYSMSLWGFFSPPQSGKEIPDFWLVRATERINVQHTQDQALSRGRDWLIYNSYVHLIKRQQNIYRYINIKRNLKGTTFTPCDSMK